MRGLLMAFCCLRVGTSLVVPRSARLPLKPEDSCIGKSGAPDHTPKHDTGTLNRREACSIGFASFLATTTAALTPLQSIAANADLSSSQQALNTLLQRLRSVPTFCIVDKEGAAYMLYKQGEGFAKGYAFITFAGALAVLGDAKRTAEKGGYADVWEPATITVIPADIAVRLALQPRQRTSQKEGAKASSIVAVIPGVDEREAAIQVDKKFKDQDKVPLFFFEGFRRNSDGLVPLYFNPRDLVEDWKKQAGESAIPPRIQAMDLVTMFQYVLRGRSDELPIKTDQVVFVTPSETLEVAAKLKEEGLAPYKTDRMII